MSLTLAEARARAALVSDVSYEIDLDLTPAGERFGCRTTVGFVLADPGAGTFLELQGADDLAVTVNGRAVEPAYDGTRLALGDGLVDDPTARNEVVVEARLPYVTDGNGMHTFTDPADGERYVSAYCGMDVAQKVYACFDQNDLKAPITLTVKADPAWTVVANALATGTADGVTTFAPTPPLPPAMFVVCAGPWVSVRWDHGDLPCGWHARRSLAAELERDSDDLRRVTDAVLAHYAKLFDEPFPFDSCDAVLAPELNWGAMETPGCVTYRDEFLPVGRITEDQRTDRGMVIAHELAHMWFGDLATMTWWDDTWLQESFADYLGFRVAEEAAGFADTLVHFEAGWMPNAHVADERRSTHPVAPVTEDVVDVDTAFGNFDSISYAKGNACLRQLVTWLGDDDFFAGVNAYLSRHRFANATLADFVDCLDAASDRDVRGWVEAWLRTTGHDTLRVTRDGDVPVLERVGSRPHRVRVTSYDASLVVRDSRLLDLGDEPVRLDDWTGLVVVPNSDGHTYAVLDLDEPSAAAVAAHLADVADPITRAVLWTHAYDEVRAGRLDVDGYLDLLRRHAPQESSVPVLEAALEGNLQPIQLRHTPAEPAAAVDEAVAVACTAGLAAHPGEQLAVAFLRGLAATSDDVGLLRTWLRDGRSGPAHGDVDLDPSLRWRVVHRLARLDGLDDELLEGELARDRSSTGELGAARARAARPHADAKAAAWAAMTGDDKVSNRMFRYLAQGLWDPCRSDLCSAYVDRYLDEMPGLLVRRGASFSQAVTWAFPAVALTDAQVAILRRVLDDPDVELLGVLRRGWEDHYDDLARRWSAAGAGAGQAVAGRVAP